MIIDFMGEKDKPVDQVHWLTAASEKVLLAIIGIATCIAAFATSLSDVFGKRNCISGPIHAFIFTEILAMVAAFYSSKRIPVTFTDHYCHNSSLQINCHAK